jgi:predicted MFS family arabinose efflux permease
VPYLAAAASVALIASWPSPSLPVSMILWLACGFFAAYTVSVMTRFVRRTPAEVRGQVVGLGSSGLVAVQGIGSGLAGLVVTVWSPAAAVGASGLAALLTVLLLFNPLRRAEGSPTPALTVQPA